MALLDIDNLAVHVEGTEILRSLSMHVEEGTVHALVGPNGAGKSTTLYTLMGLHGYKAARGDILLDGDRINDLPIHERARRGLSLAWQEPARFEGLTVRQFLAAGAAEEGEGVLKEALEHVALDPARYLDRMVDESLSGGERKRIELASIVTMRPRLMVADEPDSGIDVAALEHMLRLFEWLCGNGTTVLMVTHSSEVMAHANTATLVCCGRTVEEGPASRIRRYFVDNCLPCPNHDAHEKEA